MLSAVTENLRFMVHEVLAQVEETLQFFAEPSRTLLERINSRDSYIDTLKSVIQERTYALLQAGGRLEKRDVNLLRSVNTISGNLERIADFAVNMLRQSSHLTELGFINYFEYESYFEEILAGLERIQPALEKRDISLAFRICQAEFKLDELYGGHFNRILMDLRAGGETGNLITCLMILHYLERMGDSLLNIGEAIIFALVGENVKIQQYRALTESLSASGLDTPIGKVEFESIWGTRSGCRIGVVGEKARKDSARPVLFKHGQLKKIQKEKENIEHWASLMPDLPPQVCGYLAGEDGQGSILLEYLPGCTFQELILTGDEVLMRNALFMMEDTLGHVWRTTMSPVEVRAGFVDQIRGRIDAVLRVHPYFNSKSARIGPLKVASFGELLRAVDEIEREVRAPFTVLIHGDLNANNIIFNSTTERLHFIDLHRSTYTDYLQDVSVFMVSMFRLPVFDLRVRHRLNFAIMDFFEFAKDFATSFHDETFEARLALGLSRSFYSSTRFELNRKFARNMYQRAVFLLEKLNAHRGRPWPEFELPGEVLIYS